jgi:uncharacterized membrane protein YfhO
MKGFLTYTVSRTWVSPEGQPVWLFYLTEHLRNGLVMSDAYYPGWRIWVDDTEAQLDRANYAFRAVALPAGEHIVRSEFDPVPWHVGLTITLTAMVGLSLIAMVRLMKLRCRSIQPK